MIKKVVTSTIILLLSIHLSAQVHQADVFLLHETITGDQTYEASKKIVLEPGFVSLPLSSQEKFLGTINPFLVFEPTGGSTGGPNSGDNGVVGTLPGILDVSDMGSAMYNISIQVPDGVAGMKPNLGLNYNSLNANGLLGWGWNLTGSSEISRAGTTIYHDGFIDGVDFDANDKYLLSGTRLLNLPNEIDLFHTEYENFSKIEVKQRDQNGPVWFEVKTKDGKILEFGNTVDSREMAEGTNYILSWHLNRIKDLKGNIIDFEYSNSGSVFKVNNIYYGGNIITSKANIYKVHFTYLSGRHDVIKNYVAGSESKIEDLLSKIEIVYLETNTIYSTYELGYDLSGQYSKLQTITLEDRNVHLNPTRVNWGIFGDGILQEVSANEDPMGQYSTEQFFLDINGDGLSDVIKIDYYVETEDGYSSNKGVQWYYRLRNSNNTFGIKRYFPSGINPSEYFCNLLVGDFNGDNRDDFLDLRYSNIRKDSYVINRVFFSNGEGFNVISNQTILAPSPNYPEFLIGDFDGNGKDELMTVFKFKNVNEDNVFIKTFQEEVPNSTDVFWVRLDCGNVDYHEAKLFIGDFNGDGRSDLLKTVKYGGNPQSSRCGIYIVDIPSDQLIGIYDDGYPTTWHQVYPGDFNGDGITDILTCNNSAVDPDWLIGLYDGTGFHLLDNTPQIGNFNLNNSLDAYSHALILSDFDGDAKTDIMHLEKNEDYTADYTTYYSNGNNFDKTSDGMITSHGGFSQNGFFNHVNFDYLKNNIDFNGDGFSDLYLDEGVWGDLIYLHEPNNKYLFMESIENGLGCKSSVTYKPLTDNTIYTKNNSAIYPLSDIQTPLKVVASLSQQIGNNEVTTKNFKYEGLTSHQLGIGILGYTKNTVINNLTNLELVTVYDNITVFDYTRNQNKYYFHYPHVITLYKGTDILNETTNSYELISNSSNSYIYSSYLNSSVSHIHDYTTLEHVKMSKVDNDYDNYGNILFMRELVDSEDLPVNSPNSTFDYQRELTYTYNPVDLSNWILGQVNNVVTSERYKTEPIINNGKSYIYYQQSEAHFPFLKEEIEKPNNDINDPLLIKHVYGYDNYGNKTVHTISAPNYSPSLPEKTTRTEYSAEYQNRFPTVHYNNLNYESSRGYDEVFGTMTSSNDVNNFVSIFSQNAFSIDSKSTLPDGSIQKSALRWAEGHPLSPTHAQASYYSWSQSSGKSENYIFYDKTGMELRSVSKGFDGSYIFVDMSYDIKGRLISESLPYTDSPLGNQTTYHYDLNNRIDIITQSDGTTITKSYEGNVIRSTVSKGGISQTGSLKYNALGWLEESTDNGGKVIKNEYTSTGNVRSAYISSLDATKIEIEYDSHGNKKVLDDPNYGEVLYKYNAYNELVEEKDPKLQLTTYSYDALGRVVSVTNPEGAINYVYNETEGKLGTLKETFSLELANSVEYVYDNLLRIKNVKEKIDELYYITDFGYDKLGRTFETKYPTGVTTVNYYNEQGFLSAIRTEDNISLWNLQEVNNMGQIIQVQVGNGLVTKKTYYPESHKLKSILTQEIGNVAVQDLEYNYNEMGNMLSRKKWLNRDQSSYLTESFEYDGQNRLTNIRLNDVLMGSHGYDNAGLGNIVSKESDGKMIYFDAEYGNLTGPNAINSAKTTSGIFPESEQIISYNSSDLISTITEGDNSLELSYGVSNQRIKQSIESIAVSISKVYTSMCEYVNENGNSYSLTYLASPEGIYAIVKKSENTEEVYYIHTDHLGSWNTITDKDGVLMQELSFDAWGNRREPNTWRSYTGTIPQALFDRGFTGHEHLYAFNIINMNGRMYDPSLGRMLSVDNFIQTPESSQNFNRYSYCLNNPLEYTDPTGESYAAIYFIFAVLTDYTANLIAGYSDPLGLAVKNVNRLMDGVNSCLQFPIVTSSNGTITAGLDPFNFGISVNGNYHSGDFSAGGSIGISAIPGAGMNAGVGASYKAGDFTLSANVSSSSKNIQGLGWTSTYGIGGGIDYNYNKNESIGIRYSFVGNYKDKSKNQAFAGFTYKKGDFSMSLQNDFFAFQHEDRWRTNAWEIKKGNLAIGSFIYTNDPDAIKSEYTDEPSPSWGCNWNGYRTWKNGEVNLAPIYFGYTDMYGNSSRVGFSHKLIQDLQQNGLHRLTLNIGKFNILGFGNQNYYLNYENMFTGIYMSNAGYYNSSNLYGF